jgi:hypothetical protein
MKLSYLFLPANFTGPFFLAKAVYYIYPVTPLMGTKKIPLTFIFCAITEQKVGCVGYEHALAKNILAMSKNTSQDSHLYPPWPKDAIILS